MYCSQCGRKLREGMLFCPFCGAEIVLPEQDGPGEALPSLPETRAPAQAADGTVAAQLSADEIQPDGSPTSRRALRRARTGAAHDAGEPDGKPPVRIESPFGPADDPEPQEESEVASIFDAVDAPEEASPAAVPEEELREEEPSSSAVDAPEETDSGNPPPMTEEQSRDGDPAPAVFDVPEPSGDWRSAYDDWLEDMPEASVPERPRPASTPKEGPKPALRHRSAPGEAVPVQGRRTTAPARRGNGRRGGAGAAGRPGRSSLSGGASQNTVVPKKLKPGELFLDDVVPEERDAYDDEPDLVEVAEEKNGFFVRHLRSMVGLILLAALAFIIGVYAVSDPGQTSLARLGLAWRPEIYSRLGKESYNVGRFQQAGAYYEQALKRDPKNYSYASSAAKCYLDGKNNSRAAEMLKKCIALMPTAEDPYLYLLSVYPDPVSRPLEITQLLLQGYQMTGSERLREAAEGGT